MNAYVTRHVNLFVKALHIPFASFGFYQPRKIGSTQFMTISRFGFEISIIISQVTREVIK